MRKNLLALILVFTFVFPSALFAQTVNVKITKQEKRIAETITAEDLSLYLHFVASDEMGGRDTPSRGLDLTAKFLAMMLAKWGFKPGGDNGTFFQKFDIRYDASDPEKSAFKIGDQAYRMNEDYFRLTGEGTVAGANLVFGGNGWMIKSKNYDALSGVDVKGKIVVLYPQGFPNPQTLTNPPMDATDADFAGVRGTDWADPITNAVQKGAVGIIVVPSPLVETRWMQIKSFLSRGNAYPEKLRKTDENANKEIPKIPVTLVSKKVSDQIFAGESANATSARAFEIGKTAAMTLAGSSYTRPTQNVVAIWEGGDAKLKNEYVAIGAHYDHVGTNENAPGEDKIWNGADDDGSGTVAVLEIGETLANAKVRPKRSILLVWHAGEEKGLWGSEYFNKFPTVDIKQVVAQLNIDMIGRSKKPDDTNPKNKDLSGENEIYVIGSEMMSSALGAVTKQTNSKYLNMNYNYRYDAPNDPNRFFFRSDHFNYAVNGIPVVFWFDGEHEDYHGAGDHADKIDYQKMEKVTRTIFLTLWEIAQMNQRPAVDKQLPPELTQR